MISERSKKNPQMLAYIEQNKPNTNTKRTKQIKNLQSDHFHNSKEGLVEQDCSGVQQLCYLFYGSKLHPQFCCWSEYPPYIYHKRKAKLTMSMHVGKKNIQVKQNRDYYLCFLTTQELISPFIILVAFYIYLQILSFHLTLLSLVQNACKVSPLQLSKQ